MRVLLISANTETINMVPLPLGLNCVAVAVRNAGHEVEMIDLMGSGDNRSIIEDAVMRLYPQVIGVSVRNHRRSEDDRTKFLLDPVHDALTFCREISGAPIVVGGAGYSIFPAEVLRYLNADMGIRCEGEAAFPALLAAMEQERNLATIPGLSLAGDDGEPSPAIPSPLDALPLPDPHLWHIPAGSAADLWIPFQTRRGCPMRCSYCSTPCLEGTTAMAFGNAQRVDGGASLVRDLIPSTFKL